MPAVGSHEGRAVCAVPARDTVVTPPKCLSSDGPNPRGMHWKWGGVGTPPPPSRVRILWAKILLQRARHK